MSSSSPTRRNRFTSFSPKLRVSPLLKLSGQNVELPHPEHLRVSASKLGNGAGQGLFVLGEVEKGEVIFDEAPYFVHHDNVDVLACDHCMAPLLGSPEDEIEALSLLGRNITELRQTQHLPPLAQLDPRYIPRKPIPCRGKCGLSFCSTFCEEAAHESNHKLLCTGFIPSNEISHPLFQFKWHLVEREMQDALFGAKLLAHTLIRANQYLAHCERQNKSWTNDTLHRAALLPFLGFQKPLWWETIGGGPNFASKFGPKAKEQVKEICNQAKAEVTKAAELLRAALQPHIPPRCEALLDDADTYGRLMGMLHQNSMELELQNPLWVYFEAMFYEKQSWAKDKLEEFSKVWDDFISLALKMRRDQLLHPLEIHRMAEVSNETISSGLTEEEIQLLERMEAVATDEIFDSLESFLNKTEVVRWILPDITGTAMLPLAWMINHSCSPNARLDFIWSNEGIGPGQACSVFARITAIRKLKRGEELSISYISESSLKSGVLERQSNLADYQFICNCERCLQELQARKG